MKNYHEKKLQRENAALADEIESYRIKKIEKDIYGKGTQRTDYHPN
ncbi:hypothetical protein GCM10020331_053110 [Ectobacillus funiculus]